VLQDQDHSSQDQDQDRVHKTKTSATRPRPQLARPRPRPNYIGLRPVLQQDQSLRPHHWVLIRNKNQEVDGVIRSDATAFNEAVRHGRHDVLHEVVTQRRRLHFHHLLLLPLHVFQMLSLQNHDHTTHAVYNSQLPHTHNRTTRCLTPAVFYTKVDAQCDKRRRRPDRRQQGQFITMSVHRSWQHLWRSTCSCKIFLFLSPEFGTKFQGEVP